MFTLCLAKSFLHSLTLFLISYCHDTYWLLYPLSRVILSVGVARVMYELLPSEWSSDGGKQWRGIERRNIWGKLEGLKLRGSPTPYNGGSRSAQQTWWVSRSPPPPSPYSDTIFFYFLFFAATLFKTSSLYLLLYLLILFCLVTTPPSSPLSSPPAGELVLLLVSTHEGGRGEISDEYASVRLHLEDGRNFSG